MADDCPLHLGPRAPIGALIQREHSHATRIRRSPDLSSVLRNCTVPDGALEGLLLLTHSRKDLSSLGVAASRCSLHNDERFRVQSAGVTSVVGPGQSFVARPRAQSRGAEG